MNAMAYLKNVGKSMGYIAVDIYKDYHPVSSSFMSESKQFGQELYEGVKSFSASVQDAKTDPDSLLNLGKSSVKEAAINIIADLKSGTWYNKQRYDEQTNAAIAESMGFSLDGDDFDWGDNDSDFDDEDSTPEDDIDTRNTKAHMANDNRNTIANIKSMDRMEIMKNVGSLISIEKINELIKEAIEKGLETVTFIWYTDVSNKPGEYSSSGNTYNYYVDDATINALKRSGYDVYVSHAHSRYISINFRNMLG